MMQFIEHRVTDPRILRLIRKWLTAGVSEKGEWTETKAGTPQGASSPPLLANVYLHYVLDQWVQAWREKCERGDVTIVRYADDFVTGFQYREEAERFRQDLMERRRKFGLELHPEKTRLIEFGRYAGQRRTRRGEGKPETFDFLGFTHICGQNWKTGRFTVKRKTVAKRMAAQLHDLKTELRRQRHAPPAETGRWLRSVVRGYLSYHAVPGNPVALRTFRNDVLWQWWKSPRRRSQRTRCTWRRFERLVKAWIPEVTVMHPYPDARFAASIQGRNRVR